MARDPNFALAWAGLAKALSRPRPHLPADAPAKATAAARRALSLDPLNAEAHATLGFIHLFYDWNWSSAENELRQALSPKPNSARAHDWYAIALLTRGRTAAAIVEAERAHALDPASIHIASDVALAHYLARDFIGAERAARAISPADRTWWPAQTYLVSALAAQGRFDEALAALALLFFIAAMASAAIQSPSKFLGFEVGADRALADYRQIVSYFRALAAASPRVQV